MEHVTKNFTAIIMATLLFYIANSQAMISPEELQISTKLGEAKALCSINAFSQTQSKISEIYPLLKQQEEKVKPENIFGQIFCTQSHEQIQELKTYMQAQSKACAQINSNVQARQDAIGAFSDSQEKLYKTFG